MLKLPAQSLEEITPSGTVDHGATTPAKKQLKWQQVGPRRTAKGELLLELNGGSKSNTAKQTGIRMVSDELCVEVRDLDSLVEKENIAAADTSAIKSLRPSFAGTQLAVVCLQAAGSGSGQLKDDARDVWSFGT
ncbi:GL19680 [Drosophila persimilis]|uniref:GL19680 n=1 Tax=Drosophila persimilis TaxID=7234 RepID=B4HCV6_DROPE|nr:GL19680 [Drosophila persimilis]